MAEEVPIENLTLLDDNPRQVKSGAIERLAKSLNTPRGRALFSKRPCLANDRDGKLIVYAGNQRLRAAKLLGWDTVPCVIEKISLKEEREETIKDNLVIGEWDDDILANNFDLEDLEGWGMDLKELGIEPLGDDETDEVPELPKEARAERGKIYQLGKHRVMCGDSTNAGDVALLMDGKKADMVFTDPPYGVSYEEKAKRNGYKGETSSINGDDSVESASAIYGEAFKRISENIRDGAEYYVCAPQGGDQEMMMMMMMMRSTIPCRHQLIWKKDSPVFSMGRLDYDYQHEPILYGWKGSHKHVGNGRFKSSVWEIPRPKASKLHPTMKPVELIVEAVLNGSEEGFCVIDLFLGSGSTLMACEQTKRICYGMEIDPKYVDVIIERFCNYTGQDKEEIYNASR